MGDVLFCIYNIIYATEEYLERHVIYIILYYNNIIVQTEYFIQLLTQVRDYRNVSRYIIQFAYMIDRNEDRCQ